MSQNPPIQDIKGFTSQVANLTQLLNDFSATLDKEAAAIKAADIDNMQASRTAKQALAEELNTVGLAIEASLPKSINNLVDFSISDSFSTLEAELQEAIKSTINLTIKCHDKNMANGMSIQILSNINENALDIVAGSPKQGVKLYGSSGEKTTSGNKTSLGKA